MEKKFCDICKKEVKLPLDRIFNFSYGEASKVPFMRKGAKGEICEVCVKSIRDHIEGLKK